MPENDSQLFNEHNSRSYPLLFAHYPQQQQRWPSPFPVPPTSKQNPNTQRTNLFSPPLFPPSPSAAAPSPRDHAWDAHARTHAAARKYNNTQTRSCARDGARAYSIHVHTRKAHTHHCTHTHTRICGSLWKTRIGRKSKWGTMSWPSRWRARVCVCARACVRACTCGRACVGACVGVPV